MKVDKFFTYEESGYMPNWFIIRINFDKLPCYFTEGSFNILPARLMNLSYAQYLRMCRDLLGAQIIGRTGYPVAYFKDNDTLKNFIKTLNERAAKVLSVTK